MGLSSRLIVAAGLGVVGAGLLVAPIQGQQDGAVRKTNGGASQFKEGTPPVIGTIDLDGVFKNYEKVKYANEEFQASLLAKRNELMKLQQEMAQEAEVLNRYAPGQEEFKKQENKLTELKAKIEAGREQAEREFQSKEAEAMASLYNEVTEVAKKIAKARKMTYVMKVTNQQPSGANPNSVMAAMSNPMIYFDSANDITQDVVYNLNAVYKAAGGPTAKAAPPAADAPGAAATTPPAAAAAPKAIAR
ncbi:OmpH family outer membrane protein [Planctomyces sp. SH-PL62]|uniref:OmpH family outer membrane protein n=1 Tax=Planctomyces sp. SH-PL62 TaxID=1636152 RepID=UPI00078C1BE4|nr:OmpH family outer membrane protein [Planctomyces sp. SH-PL62]AMV39755.1 Outer membrane protein (OmpH-like) [Planctomyces sp. SH-PL62]